MEMHLDDVQIARTFNHDLLLTARDQEAASQRWPALAPRLIDAALIQSFSQHAQRANALKRAVQMLGSAAVLTMVVALLGYGAELWSTATHSYDIADLPIVAEFSAVVSLMVALLASRYGPLRRRWLKHRFITEVLRQWHFRGLLEAGSTGQTNRDLSILVTNLAGSVGAKMDELAGLRRDPLGRIPHASLPADPNLRAQLLDAYRVLRLDHQRGFAMHKLSADDKTFAGLSLLALSNITSLLAGTTLVLALACALARLFVPFAWAPIAGISLAVTGVAVRAWRDGFSLEQEEERYQEMVHELELLTARWEEAGTEELRFRVAEEVEQAALEELRAFIRSHERAQFLF
jgi:hypothetical protein